MDTRPANRIWQPTQPRHYTTSGKNITKSSAPEDGHKVARNMLINLYRRNKYNTKWHLVGFLLHIELRCTVNHTSNVGKLFTPWFIFRTPRGLEDVSMYPELFAELLRSGQWTVGDLKQVAGLNLLRVFAKVEKVNSLSDKNVLCVCLWVRLLNVLRTVCYVTKRNVKLKVRQNEIFTSTYIHN